MVDAAYGEVSKIAKRSVAMFVARSTLSRMQEREGLNTISYMQRKHQNPQPQNVPEFDAAFTREAARAARFGTGTPLQNDIARRAFGMPSIELANLTMFNQFRAELEPQMWDEISALTGKDATPNSKDVYRTTLIGFDRPIVANQHVGAMRIGLKRHLGTLDDGAEVKARTTAIINTSPSSGFNPELLDRFRDLSDTQHPYDSRESLDTMAQLPEFQRAVAWLIDAKPHTGLVLARNETVYVAKQQNRSSTES